MFCYDFSYSLALLRALGVRFCMPILCLAAKNRRRKGTQAFPLGTPCFPTAFGEPSGFFVFSEILPLGRISARPRGETVAKSSAFFCLPLVVAMWREMQKERRCLSPMFSLKSGTKGEIQEGTSWRVSSAASWACQEAALKTGTAQRVTQSRSMSVKRRRCLKIQRLLLQPRPASRQHLESRRGFSFRWRSSLLGA